MPFTFNGFGTKYYGRGEPEADSSFVSTEWIVAAYLPIIPLGSYRLMRNESADTNLGLFHSTSYLVISKLPICWPQVGKTYAFMFGTLGWWAGWLWLSAGPLNSVDLGPIGAIVAFLAVLIAPFVLVWWVRRQAEQKAIMVEYEAELTRQAA